MNDLESMIRSVGDGIADMRKAVQQVDEYTHNIEAYYGGIERMKNCVNCDHSEVCLVVAQRKARKANDYSPCSKWKLVEK